MCFLYGSGVDFKTSFVQNIFKKRFISIYGYGILHNFSVTQKFKKNENRIKQTQASGFSGKNFR